MREQSQKSEMAAALKGDFERLRQRGVATTLGPVDEETDASATAAPEAAADDERTQAPAAAPPETVRPPAPVASPSLPVFTRPAAPIRDAASASPPAADAVAPDPAVEARPPGAADGEAPPDDIPVVAAEEQVAAPAEAAPRRSLLGRLFGRP